MGLKRPYLMNRSINIFGMMAKVSLVRKAIAVISKETGGWLLPKQVQIINKSIKINLLPTPSKTFCNGLDFGTLLDPRHYV